MPNRSLPSCPPEFLLTLSILILAAAPGGGAVLTIHPDGSGDYATIQAAVDAAVPDDVIELTDGVFTGSGNSDVWSGGNLVFRSAGADPAACIIDLGEEGYFGCVGYQVTLDLEAITFRGGNMELGDFGPSPNSPVDFTAENCVFEACALAMLFYVEGTLTSCRFEQTGVFSSTAGTFVGCTFLGTGGGGGWAGSRAIMAWNRLVVEDCFFSGWHAPDQGGAIYLDETWDETDVLITGSVFLGNSAEGDGGAVAVHGLVTPTPDLVIEHCTFHDNSAPAGSAVSSSGAVSLSHCLVTGGGGGPAVHCANGGTAQLACSDLFGNEGGDWVGCIADQLDHDGNVSLDPCFCDPGSGGLHLCADSWCLPSQHPAGCLELIGALGAGCAACNCASGVGVEKRSWGSLKGLFR